MCGIIRL